MRALIDGDLICYRLGFICQSKPGFEPAYVAPEGIVKHRVDEFISDILMFDLEIEQYDGYLSLDSTSNFRNAVAVTAPYKGNRKAAKPVHHEFIRQYLLSEWQFKGVTGQEADDSLAQEQTEAGDSSIIVSIDKDMLQVPGFHYDFVKRKKTYVTPDTGFYNFCIQMLTGDRTDNIIGIRGYGPVKAMRCLAEADNSELRLRAVAEVYRGSGDENLQHFRENAKLLWLRRRKDGGPELIDEMIGEMF